MSKSTFATKQPLKSLEFGMLLHKIVQKGVYEAPDITLSTTDGSITVTGGVFLFYDTDVSKSYAVRVEDVSLSISGISEDKFLFITYTYNATSQAEPALVLGSQVTSDETKIRLGRIVRINSSTYGFAFDSSCMELCGPGYSNENSFIDVLSFSTQEANQRRLIAQFNGKIISNTGVISISAVDTMSFAGLDINKDQYLYINSEGTLICADSTVPRFGKLVVAEKKANRDFVINRFPHLPEIGAWNLEVKKPESGLSAEAQAIYDEAINITKNELNTQESVASIASLLLKAISHIAALEIRINNDLETRLAYLEAVKMYLNGVITIPGTKAEITGPANQLDMTKVKITNEVNIAGAVTVDPNLSSFGTSTQPIKNLYVTNSLYTDKLFVTE